MNRSARRRTQLVAGALTLVVLLALGIVLWLVGGARLENNVENLARAPVGCDTTLDFDSDGEFLVYVETVGRLGEVSGDCEASGDYDLGDVDPPSVTLSLRDPEGDVVDLDTASGSEYDAAGFVGVVDRSVVIEVPGDHVLTVESSTSAPFAVAVGRDPRAGVALLRWGALAAVIVGLLVGGLLLVLGSRRTPNAPDEGATWQPAASTGPGFPDWPVGPPGFPPPPPTTGATGPAGVPPVRTPPPPPRPPSAPPGGGDAGWGPPTR